MDFIQELVNRTPYLSGHQSTLLTSAPFYCQDSPSYDYIRTHGCNCAGLVNLLQTRNHLPIPGVAEHRIYAGGTEEWFQYLDREGMLEPIDMDKSYMAGSLLVRKYRDATDQGHLAVLYTSGKLRKQELLHSYDGAGITIDASVAMSHAWKGGDFYEFIVPSWFYPALRFTTEDISDDTRDFVYLHFAIYSAETQPLMEPQGRFFVRGNQKISLLSAYEVVEDFLDSQDSRESQVMDRVAVETIFYLVTHRFYDDEHGFCEVRVWY